MAIEITQKIKKVTLVPKEQVTKEVKQTVTPITLRPKELGGTTYKLKSPLTEHALYITINHIEINNKKFPFEIFINTKSLEHQQWIITLTRLISAIFRQHATYNNDLTFIIEELKSVFDPNGGYTLRNKKIPSLVAEIGNILELHLIKLGIITDSKDNVLVDQIELEKKRNDNTSNSYLECSNCHTFSVVKAEGCFICLECGDSKCS